MEVQLPGDNYKVHKVKNLDDLLKVAEKIDDGACSGGVFLDGHSSDIYKYLSWVEADDVREAMDDDKRAGKLRDALDRITGDTKVPFTVTACSGWSQPHARPMLANWLDRPLISASYGCTHPSAKYFATTGGTWKIYSPDLRTEPKLLDGVTEIEIPGPVKPQGKPDRSKWGK